MDMTQLVSRRDKISAAINNLLAGGVQSYDLDGQSVTKLDLGWLSREEDQLSARINRAGRRSGAFRQAMPK